MLASREANAGASVEESHSDGPGVTGGLVGVGYGVHGALPAARNDPVPVRMSGGSGVGPGEAGAETGVEAQGHFILGLSLEAFRSTSVDEVILEEKGCCRLAKVDNYVRSG